MTDKVYKWLCGTLATQPSQAKWDRKYSGEPYRAVLGHINDYLVVSAARRCWSSGSWRPAPNEILSAAVSIASGGVTDTTPSRVAECIRTISTLHHTVDDRLMAARAWSVHDRAYTLVPHAVAEMGFWDGRTDAVAAVWEGTIRRFAETLDMTKVDPSTDTSRILDGIE
jgi:hypothetical protein